MFDEYFNPPPSVASLVPAVVAPEPADPTSTPSSTSIDQGAPSTSTSQTPQESQLPVIPFDVEEQFHDIEGMLFQLIPVSTRHQLQTEALFCYFDAFFTSVEPKNYKEALQESCWIKAMQEELNEFERLKVWEIVPRPDRVMIITLKWIFKVKLDKMGGVLKNKARLVVRGYRQEEGINFEESFAPIAFLNGTAWYDLLSSFLLSQKFSKGAVDPTFITQKKGKDILLVQIYVDDIIFASTNPTLCVTFSKIICSKFKMSMMGKMLFFLGIQISQCPTGIFLNQSKYDLEIIKKYGMESCDPIDTLMVEKSKLDADPLGKEVDPTRYRRKIVSLMYMTASRPDLVFVVYMCAKYQVKPTKKNLYAIMIMLGAKIPDDVL
ncbi:retrovirus-related pol polyprotein from transposon TNT 1-94 [Tanacetum coccineum]|uniref:Retrovirus-related pol polyprotein from transposon TNT 1-94 n=1 Tax=Tanacetum coccineum TaxID=301880 RepID=A0ABQ4Z565_9ASTR